MTATQKKPEKPDIRIEQMETLSETDLHDLCDATDAAIESGGGFGWVNLPARNILERYWQGVLLIPERLILAGRLDGTICGAAQLVLPSRNNEAQAHLATILALFVAPWARGHGIAQMLLEYAETVARDHGIGVLQLDVRDTQDAAIRLYDKMGYKRWGTNPHYSLVDGRFISGLFYTKVIDPRLIGPDSRF